MAEFSEKIDEILKVEDNKENSFEKVEKFLDSLTRFTIKHTINDTKDFLAFLGALFVNFKGLFSSLSS